MNKIEDLQQLIKDGFADWQQHGDVRAIYKDDLVLFNYTHAAQLAGRWNWFERASRGLILDDATGDVVARPFDKFFNWGERDRRSTEHIISVTEKLDGSLGILYWHAGWHVATRGSFDGEQAIWATEFFRRKWGDWIAPHGITYLFEIIYPENRIVVDYGEREDLVLLAARDITSGSYISLSYLVGFAQAHGFALPEIYHFDSVTDILEALEKLDATAEGWVAEFSDGQRFKFKGEQYFEVHRLVTNATFKRVVQAIAAGAFDDMVSAVPDEFLGRVRTWQSEIEEKVKDVQQRIETAFEVAPKEGRKEFALWVNANHKELSSYLFKRFDGHDYLPLIYKREF